MRGVNSVTLIGNIGKDPEVTYTQSGLTICKFSLATTENRKNANGEWEPEVSWHRIVVFGKQAESAGKYLKKGSQAYIEGKISYGSYEKEGIKHYTTDIICNSFIMCGGDYSKPDSASIEEKQHPKQKPLDTSPPTNEEWDEDLPF